jgi:tRNA (guanosine-2'-O-)-methyltransferase
VVSRPAVRVRTPKELRSARRGRPSRCLGHLYAAPLWPLHGVNLGTLLRTCDAVGACLAVPRLPWVPEALRRGNTLRAPACVHWVRDPLDWLAVRRAEGAQVLGVELAEEAVRLADLLSAEPSAGVPRPAGAAQTRTQEGPSVGPASDRRTGLHAMSYVVTACLRRARTVPLCCQTSGLMSAGTKPTGTVPRTSRREIRATATRRR